MPWYIDARGDATSELSERARIIVEMLSRGRMPPITPQSIDAVMELIEHDVLKHTEHDTEQARLRALGAMIEAADPQPRR